VQAPLRLLVAFRPTVAPALLVAVAAGTIVFAATPFIIPAVATEHGVSTGTAGLVSAAQLSGFVAASWFGGRFLRPVRAVFVVGALLGVVANLTSALAPTFGVLAASRAVSGVSLGLAAWFAWQAAFGDAARTGDVAVVGPLVGMIVAPAIAVAIETFGIDGTFVLLAVVDASPLLFVSHVRRHHERHPHRTRHAPTRAARAILLALGAITLGGSSVFVYGAAIGTDANGMSALAVSLVYSVNSLASIPSARWLGRRGPAGIWFLTTALSALLIAVSRNPLVFTAAMATWGFVFFMGVPAAFTLLASRSNFPEERAGDAQAVMALGRVFGPLLGGLLVGREAFGALGIVAAGALGAASLVLLYVERRRFLVVRRPAPVEVAA
jgi:predicted MFS family arabinose efflux permease